MFSKRDGLDVIPRPMKSTSVKKLFGFAGFTRVLTPPGAPRYIDLLFGEHENDSVECVLLLSVVMASDHFIPQFYLRHFQIAGRQGWIYSYKRGMKPKPIAIKSVA